MRRYILLGLMMLGISVQAQRMDDTDTHSKYIQAVDEYRPAPGQFVNTMPEYEAGDDAQRMAQKCTEYLAQESALDRSMVCLGAYGGYIVFHFDHSIANIVGERDLLIEGNAFQSNADSDLAYGSSEPGIVMVSQDVNHNGLPDDPWYELSGSADVDSVGKVVYGYQITYQRKRMEDIPWSDNQGQTGVIARNTYHDQEYYPEWIADELVFQGTLLPKSIIFRNGQFAQIFLREGYVDNRPDKVGNSFDIDWAVDEHRQPVHLDFVDFVKVYTAVNQAAPMIGESSTEISNAEDLHLEASIQKIKAALAGIQTVAQEQSEVMQRYTLDGRRALGQKGVMLEKMTDGTVRKRFYKQHY